jgi:site-specific DNA-methyltransferase (adenine-specific)
MKPYFEVLPALNFNCFVTDPPYGIGFQNYSLHRDSPDEYGDLLQVLGSHPSAVLNYPIQHIDWTLPVLGRPDSMLTWVYNSNLKRQTRQWWLYGMVPDFTKFKQPCKNPGAKPSISPMVASYDWMECNQIKNVNKGRNPHPCVLPRKVVDWVVAMATEPQHVICDPFAGTGTVLESGIAYGHQVVGVEMDEKYCELAAKRLSQKTLFSDHI